MNVIADADIRLFTAFVLLNLTGYNRENGWLFGDTRKQVRLKLAQRAKYWQSQLYNSRIIDFMHRAGGAMVMDMIPLLSLPPEFTLDLEREDYTASWQNQSKLSLTGVDCWLQRFYEEENLKMIWDEHLSDYQAAVDYLQQLGPLLERVSNEFFKSSSTDQPQVILSPNLLDAKGRGYSLSSVDRTWLYLNPFDNLAQTGELAVHELLHRWIDVAADSIIIDNAPNSMPQAKAEFRIVADCYPELPIWIGEIAVRCATVRIMQLVRNLTSQSIEASLTADESLGFIGIKDAYEYLVSNRTRSIQAVIPDILELIRVRIMERYAPN